MGLLKIDKNNLVPANVKTTPQNVAEANQALWDDSEGNEIDLLGILEIQQT